MSLLYLHEGLLTVNESSVILLFVSSKYFSSVVQNSCPEGSFFFIALLFEMGFLCIVLALLGIALWTRLNSKKIHVSDSTVLR